MDKISESKNSVRSIAMHGDTISTAGAGVVKRQRPQPRSKSSGRIAVTYRWFQWTCVMHKLASDHHGSTSQHFSSVRPNSYFHSSKFSEPLYSESRAIHRKHDFNPYNRHYGTLPKTSLSSENSVKVIEILDGCLCQDSSSLMRSVSGSVCFFCTDQRDFSHFSGWENLKKNPAAASTAEDPLSVLTNWFSRKRKFLRRKLFRGECYTQ